MRFCDFAISVFQFFSFSNIDPPVNLGCRIVSVFFLPLERAEEMLKIIVKNCRENDPDDKPF